MFEDRPLPAADTACDVVGEYARLDLRIGGAVLTGAALHGAGGICETTERALQVIRWARADGATVRVYLVHDAVRDEGFDVPARDVEVL